MGVKSKTCEEGTILKEMFGRYCLLMAPVHDVDAIVAAININGTAVGTSLTLRTTVCPTPCTLALTQSAAGGTSLSVTIVGFNQFGEPVTEILTMASASVIIKQSSNAFLRITSITLSAKSGGFAAETLEIGFARNDATTANRTQLGLPLRVKNSTDILAVAGGHSNPASWTTAAAINLNTTYHTVGASDALQSTPLMHSVIFAAHAQYKY